MLTTCSQAHLRCSGDASHKREGRPCTLGGHGQVAMSNQAVAWACQQHRNKSKHNTPAKHASLCHPNAKEDKTVAQSDEHTCQALCKHRGFENLERNTPERLCCPAPSGWADEDSARVTHPILATVAEAVAAAAALACTLRRFLDLRNKACAPPSHTPTAMATMVMRSSFGTCTQYQRLNVATSSTIHRPCTCPEHSLRPAALCAAWPHSSVLLQPLLSTRASPPSAPCHN